MSDMTQRIFRSKAHEKAVFQGKTVETINSLPAAAFFSKYFGSVDTVYSHLRIDRINSGLEVVQDCGSGLGANEMNACFELIQETSAEDYQRSESKWSPAKKRNEMALPDMKYLVIIDKNHDAHRPLVGFVSFMITYEDDQEVAYIYEIHFTPTWQGKSFGKRLMTLVETIARNACMEKVMLTVFKANARAMQWYEKLGYIEDEFSPGPRKLRNGTIKEPTYVILSKRLKNDGG